MVSPALSQIRQYSTQTLQLEGVFWLDMTSLFLVHNTFSHFTVLIYWNSYSISDTFSVLPFDPSTQNVILLYGVVPYMVLSHIWCCPIGTRLAS